jgi:hypothetical protein
MKSPWSIILVLIFAALPSFVSADWRLFIPQPYERGAELRFMAVEERDDNTFGNNKLNWDDRYLREKFTVYSKGSVYHPRFLQYDVSFGGLLRQEDYSSSLTESTGWNNTPGVEYNAKVYLLPDHSYNAELFALRLEPLSRQRAATQLTNVETSRGAMFRYRKKPRFLNARYVENTISYASNSSQTKTFYFGGTYLKDFENAKLLTLSGSYNHPDYSNSLGLKGHSNEYLLSGLIRNSWLSLNSNLSKSNLDQSGSFSGSLGSDQFSLLELLSADLPLNFRSDFRYRHQRNTNTSAGQDASPNEISSTVNETAVTVANQLYESLDSSYTFRRESTGSTGGDSTNVGNYGYVNYTKRTGWGILMAGVDLGRSELDSSGQTAVVNETHPAVSVPGSFFLNQPQQVDPLSLQVFLKSPLPPNETILLQENVHYTVFAGGTTFQINVFSLPPRFAVPETYDFFVTYSLLSGTFKLQTDTLGYRFSFDFFSTLTPYYDYSKTGQELLSGSFPASLYDSTEQTAGLVFRRGGLRLLGEYQKLDWPVSPYNATRFEARYSDSLTSTFSLSASAEYLNKYYLESVLETRPAYTDRRTSVFLNLQKQFFDRRLRFSAGGSYSRFQGQLQGNLYSFTSGLTWRIAKLDFALGASGYHSNTTGPATPDQLRTHQYFFLNVGRKLF